MQRSITLAALVVLAGCGSAPEVGVPAALQPAGEQRAMTVSARGVQVYECSAREADCFEWAFVADTDDRRLPSDANAHCAPALALPAPASALASSGVLDPSLFRIDHAGAYHG